MILSIESTKLYTGSLAIRLNTNNFRTLVYDLSYYAYLYSQTENKTKIYILYIIYACLYVA